MGDCAVVIFHCTKDHAVSPAVYLHLHGGLVLNFLEAALPKMRTGDAGYSCARFIGICDKAIPGNASLGVINVPGVASNVSKRDRPDAYTKLMAEARKLDFGDRGIFLVEVDHWQITHAGSTTCAYGDLGDGFAMQEGTSLRSANGVLQLPAEKAAK